MSVPAMMMEQKGVRAEKRAMAASRALEEEKERENPLSQDSDSEPEHMGRTLAAHITRLHGGAYFSKFAKGLSATDMANDAKVATQMKQIRDVGNQKFSNTAMTREDSIAKDVPKGKFSADQRQIRAFGSYLDDDVGKVLPTPADLGGLYNEERLKKPAAKPLRAPRPAPAPALPPAVVPDESMVASGRRRGGMGTGRYEGQGHAIGGAAVPSFGVSQFRGGAEPRPRNKVLGEALKMKMEGGEKEPKHTLMDHIAHPKKGFGKPKRAPSARNAAISKLMREKGMTLGEASKHIKEHGM